MFRIGFIRTALVCAFAISLAGCASLMGRSDERPQNIKEFMRLDARPRVIAHRGFSGIAPENTLIAFQKAIDLGADMVELDVLLSKDGRVVVLHDETLDRTTDGEGPIQDHTWEELSKLDAGTWFTEKFGGEDYAGEPLPLLGEALDLMKDKILVNVEIKTEAYSPELEGSIAQKTLALIHDRDLEDQVIISSFDSRILAQVRQLDGDIHTATLYHDGTHPELDPKAITEEVGSNGFNMAFKYLKADVVEACHKAGLPLAIYTVNSETPMRYALGLGADALFTNYPDKMMKVMAEMKAAGR